VSLLSKNQFAFVLIVFAGLLAYSNSFSVPFQFDDDAYVVSNPTIRTFHYFLAPWEISALTDQSPTSYPPALRYAFMTRIVGYLTFAVNFRLHGLDVMGYHVVNLVIHILNGLLVYLILTATFKTLKEPPLPPGGSLKPFEIIATASALLFVIHPIQTQAVTYISQRFASLATCFFLLSLLSYIRSRTSAARNRRALWYTGALISAATAMLTKEFTFTLPVVVALYELTFIPGSRSERIRNLAPFAATMLIIPASIFMQQGSLSALDSTMRTHTAADVSNIPRIDYLLTQLKVVVLYLRLLFLPVGQNIDHDVPVSTSLLDVPVLLSFVILLALFSVGVFLYIAATRKREYPELRLASFGIIWFFVTLSVESSVIPLGELAAEYRMYLPSVGLITAFVSLAVLSVRRFSGLSEPNTKAIAGVFSLIVIILGTATYARNTVWATEISLWEDAARKSPRKVRPHQNLGTYYGMAGRLEDAKRELIAALQLAPDNYELHNNLGIVYRKLGDYDRAVQQYMIVIRLNPSDPMARYNLGNVYLAQGNLEGAIREYRAALAVIPDYDELHNNLGVAYDKSGRLDEAIAEFGRAVSLNPENTNARRNLAEAVKRAGAGPRR